eukprot:6186799-Pleurochrysis_carterae.AAC.2
MSQTAYVSFVSVCGTMQIAACRQQPRDSSLLPPARPVCACAAARFSAVRRLALATLDPFALALPRTSRPLAICALP